MTAAWGGPAKRRRLNTDYPSPYSPDAVDIIDTTEYDQREGQGQSHNVDAANASGGSHAHMGTEDEAVYQDIDGGNTDRRLRPDDQVCFGMLSAQVQPCQTPTAAEPSILCLVTPNGDVLDAQSQSKIGQLDSYNAEVLCKIYSEPGIMTQIACQFPPLTRPIKGKTKPPAGILSAIIYGPFELFDDVGDFTQQCEVYLQDPEGCALNVPYKNPHRLPRGDAMLMTFDIPSSGPSESQTSGRTAADFFVGLESAKVEEHTKTPLDLRTPLHPHQQQALTFLRRREHGWAYNGPDPDIWARNWNGLRETFVNRITGDQQVDPPPQFRGGILADEMGLGKTLSMISLIAADKDPELRSSLAILDPEPLEVAEDFVNATLIVVPSPLLQVWSTQITQHLHTDRIKWTKYYGVQRFRLLGEMRRFDIILTTFQTIASEKTRGKDQSSPIFAAHWYRIILDEAHCIRDRSTVTAKAIFSLKARCRWAMTGTPVQNRLSDFSSLLGFLRVHPYNDHKTFDTHVSMLWKDNNEEEAVRRLKRLVYCIVLRRLKTTIQLPDRRDVTRFVDFTEEERNCYEEASKTVKQMLDAALNQHDTSAVAFLNAFQRINKLRMICNLGVSASLASSRITPPCSPADSCRNSTAQAYFESLLSVGQASCSICSISLDDFSAQEANENLSVPGKAQPKLFKCLKLACSPCFTRLQNNTYAGEARGCDHHPQCPSEPVFSTSSSAPSTPLPSLQESSTQSSSKVMALVEDIQAHIRDKSVVFSYWTTSLDLVERAIREANIGYVRFDGRVTPANRELALHRLHQDPSVRVILITVSCGAVGLDLTAASRAYLLEPQWNPTTEEQALARIHRMGQERPVTTIRFIMRKSFEEHVMKVQGRKRELADLMFSGGKCSDSEQTQARLSHLRSLLG